VHRKLLAAHCLGDATLMSSLSTADIVIANRGEIVRTTDAEMRDRFTAAFKRFDYTGYRDIATPIIEISQAGDAGWIWVNVRAAGKDLVSGEAFDDQWAWLMLLKNVDGRWLHAGNASNLAE
jgi:hypothetical protein